MGNIMRHIHLSLLFLPLLLMMGCPPARAVVNHDIPPLAADSIANVESGIAVAVVIDTSGSMSGTPLETVKRVVRERILPKLDLYAMGNRLDVSVISFGGSVSTRLPMSPYDSKKFINTVDGLWCGGGTPIAESLLEAAHQLGSSQLDERHIFILTDGNGDSPADDSLTALKEAGLPSDSIHLIGFMADRDYYKPFDKVGAQVLMADNPSALETSTSLIFKAILKLEKE